MAAAQEHHVLHLLHTYWFETTVLTTNNNKTPSPLQYPTLDNNSTSQQTHDDVVVVLEKQEQFSLDSKLLRVPTLHVRSLSDQNLSITTTFGAFSDSSSPNSVLTPQQKLRPILSGKEVEEFPLEKRNDGIESHAHGVFEEIPKRKKHGQRRRLNRGKSSRSLSDLEFKELKGFMDLGFVFSEEDKDPELVSLIPGLQRLGREDSGSVSEQKKEKNDEALICRPYLSEAWGVLGQRNVNVKNPLLLNWRVPALDNEIDMKDNLRFWAHTVASIVR